MDELEHAKKIVETDIKKIVDFMNELGEKGDDGTVEMEYGAMMKTRGMPYDLFTRLKTGRQRGIFDFEGQFLMSPMHDKKIITLLKPDFKIE